MEQEDQILTINEAAKALKIHHLHLRRIINAGQIPFVNVSVGKKRNAYRILLSDLKDFLRRGGIEADQIGEEEKKS